MLVEDCEDSIMTNGQSDPEKIAAGVGNRPRNGRAPFLTIEQLRNVKEKAQHWTGRKVTDAIFEEFGVRYSPAYGNKLLAYLRLSNAEATRFDAFRAGTGKAAAARERQMDIENILQRLRQ
jgi:hypothetical protein